MTTKILSLLIGTALLAGVAHASDRQRLEAKLRAYATQELDHYKQACVCQQPGAFDFTAGILRYAVVATSPTTRQVRVWCQAWRYDGAGEPHSTLQCDRFVPLAK